MSNPISLLAALGAAPAETDLLELVDISDTSMAAAGTNKKLTRAELFTSPTIAGLITQPTTITTPGTTGNQTINKATGTVNIAAAGVSVVVTNSLVSANSIVIAILRTADETAWIHSVIPASGSFTVNLGAAATAEIAIGFWVLN